MQPQTSQVQQVIHKLQGLTPERIMEVEDFIDFLRQRDTDRQLTRTAMAISAPAFEAVWDNSEDAEYDRL